MKRLCIAIEDIEQAGYSTVTDICRDLVETKSSIEEIEVYRGEMLSYTVKNVSVMAKYEPRGAYWGFI